LDEEELNNTMEKFETKLRRYLNTRDKAFSVKVQIEEALSKKEESQVDEEKLESLVKEAKNLKEALEKMIPEIDDMLRRVRATFESMRALTRIKLLSSIVGGFLIFLGGVFLLFGAFILLGLLKAFVSETIIRFIGWLVVAFGLISLISGILHQVS